ncbi:MAG TPA: TerC family protein [Flavihumibacter sp.]|jgi:predicted tellurium resistance membrane protein TerC
MEHLLTSESIISFIILVVLEVVLGIDNVIFVSIIMNRLPNLKDRKKARRHWMIYGILMRSAMLFGLSWLLAQKGKYLFSIQGKGFDLASLVMLCGGLFLIYKSVKEIHHKLEGDDPTEKAVKKSGLGFGQAIVQIVILDAVFSFDSILTAGGTAKHVEIMIAAVVIAMFIMFRFSPAIADFIHKHPTLKMLALSFLVMIGLSLVIEGWDSEAAHQLHLKNYIYFGMAFSVGVEILNMAARRKAAGPPPITLREPRLDERSKPRDGDDYYSDMAH